MSTIRKKSIIASGVVYIGLGLGVGTNFLLARDLTPAQYGLISGMFLAISTIMFSFANLGLSAVIAKFYPYYKANLPPERNDLMGWTLPLTCGGYLLVVLIMLVFKGSVIHHYQGRSAELVHYYYWLFPFGLGLTIFSLLEMYTWQLQKPIVTNYLREVQFRVVTLILIALYLTGVLGSFGLFVKLYSFNWLVTALVLLIYLMKTKQLHFVFSRSRVTEKFFPKMRSLALLAWSGVVIYNVAFYFAQIVIGAVVPAGLAAVGLFTIAQLAGSIIQAPQRALQPAAIGPLSQAWKDKDYGRIDRIYRRSSITQLVFSVGMFSLMLLNWRDGILTFGFPLPYLDARTVFFFIGLARVVDMGTGVTQQIIGTSIFWRFDFLSGLVLVLLTLPMNYWLATKLGVVGPAIADLFTFTVYNGIRWIFLYRKFKMQPFTVHTLYTLFLGAGCYVICYLAFDRYQGLFWLFLRSLTFLGLYVAGAVGLKLSEDIRPVWLTIRKRVSGIFGGRP
jgi:O-antigen/teichoic acid export membrane protein